MELPFSYWGNLARDKSWINNMQKYNNSSRSIDLQVKMLLTRWLVNQCIINLWVCDRSKWKCAVVFEGRGSETAWYWSVRFNMCIDKLSNSSCNARVNHIARIKNKPVSSVSYGWEQCGGLVPLIFQYFPQLHSISIAFWEGWFVIVRFCFSYQGEDTVPLLSEILLVSVYARSCGSAPCCSLLLVQMARTDPGENQAFYQFFLFKTFCQQWR